MVKNQTDNEREKQLVPFLGLIFPINSKGSFILNIIHITSFERMEKNELMSRVGGDCILNV